MSDDSSLRNLSYQECVLVADKIRDSLDESGIPVKSTVIIGVILASSGCVAAEFAGGDPIRMETSLVDGFKSACKMYREKYAVKEPA